MRIRRQSGGRASFVRSLRSPQRGQMLEPWASMWSRPRDTQPAKRMQLWEELRRFWRQRPIPPESRFQPKEASCPWLYATDFPPLLACRGTFTAGKCLRGALEKNRRCPRGVIMMNSSFWQWNEPAWLIMSGVNYSRLLSTAVIAVMATCTAGNAT